MTDSGAQESPAWAVSNEDRADRFVSVKPADRQAKTTSDDEEEEGTESAAVNAGDDGDGWTIDPGPDTTLAAANPPVPTDADLGLTDDRDEPPAPESPPATAMIVGGILLAVVGGGFVLVNVVSGAVLLAGTAGVVVATGVGAATYKATRDRVKHGRRNRSSSLTPGTGRRGLGLGGRRAARRQAKAALGLTGGTGRRKPGTGLGGGKGKGRKPTSSAARSGGLVPKGRGLGKTGPTRKGKGPTSPTRKGKGPTGPARSKGAGDTSRRKLLGKGHNRPKTTAGKTKGPGRDRTAAARGGGLPRTRLGARNWANQQSPRSRAKTLKKLDRVDGLSPRRRRKLARAVKKADARDAKRAKAGGPIRRTARNVGRAARGASTAGSAFAAGAVWTARGATWASQRARRHSARTARAAWAYTHPHRAYTAAWWADTRQAARAQARAEREAFTEAVGEAWARHQSSRWAREQARERARYERVCRRHARRQARDRARRERQRQRGPIRVDVVVGEPIHPQRARPRPYPRAVGRAVAPQRLAITVAPARAVTPPAYATDPDTVDLHLDTDAPPHGSPEPFAPAAPVAAPRLQTEDPNVSIATTNRRSALEQRRATYPPHPAHLPLIAAHANLFGFLPRSVPAMIDHLNGLGDMWSECAVDVNHAGAVLAQMYPVETDMHSLYAAYATSYYGMADAARQTASAYALANPDDYQRNLHPRPNEEWNDVPEDGADRGADMGAVRAFFREAHATMWSYRYQTPLDLRDWLRGLYATGVVMAADIRPDMPLAMFPGAGMIISHYWHNLALTYVGSGTQSATVAEGYELRAADVLARHTNPRPNEALANAGRRNL